MELAEFDTNTDNPTEKYAPRYIKDIIGSQQQVFKLTNWLKKYTINASINFKKNDTKKNTRKKRRPKVIAVSAIDEDADIISNIVDDNNADTDEEIENTEECPDIVEKNRKKDPDICSCAVITGNHGIGKTALVKAVLNDLGYQIKTIVFSKLNGIRSVSDFIDNILSGVDIYESMYKKNAKKYVILVDDIQSASTPTEKNIINELISSNHRTWNCPVIFIGSNKHKKIMSIVKKECYHIPMYPPEFTDMYDVLAKICVARGMIFENEKVAENIIKYSQNDYRGMIVILGELSRLYGTEIISNKNIEEYLKFTEIKNNDRTIFDNTYELFSKYTNINNALKIFEHDKTNMLLMVQQYHFITTMNYIKNDNNLIDFVADMTQNIAHGDIVDNYIYSDQNWSLQETHGFYACVYPSYKLNNNINTKKFQNDTLQKYKHEFPSYIDYPKDQNRTSTRCINYKNVKMAREFMCDMTINEYIIAIKMIKKLLEDERLKECKELLDEYKMSFDTIKYVLKIDKINGTRKDISKTTEKKIKEISNDTAKLAVIKKTKSMAKKRS
jgi:hypothetical protein